MLINDLKQEAYRIEEELKLEFEAISDYIFNNPELGGEEYLSSSYLSNFMRINNFKVTHPYCSIPTSFLAEYGEDDSTTIAFLAEYDALPGYGLNGDENAHACGHNWIAAVSAGSAVVMSKIKEKYKFKGKIVLIGTPAEETLGSKVDIIKAGGFKKIDICLEPHIGEINDISFNAQARDSIELKFRGKATHAASTPYEGINALDGVMLTFAGINALRQHVRPDIRIHGVISEGGLAANIIPEKATCRIMTRANERKDLNMLTEKVINIARGAALMTGATMTYNYYDNSFYNLINIPYLIELSKSNLEEVGIKNINDQGIAEPRGSTDLGNVSYVCPTQYIVTALDIPKKVFVHEEGMIKYVNSLEAYDKMHKVIKALTGIAIELYLNPEMVKEIKLYHKNKINN